MHCIYRRVDLAAKRKALLIDTENASSKRHMAHGLLWREAEREQSFLQSGDASLAALFGNCHARFDFYVTFPTCLSFFDIQYFYVFKVGSKHLR